MAVSKINDLILQELRELRSDVGTVRAEMNKGFSETTQRVSVIETHTEPFFANDGGLSVMQTDINGLKNFKYKMLGAMAAITFGANWALRKLHI